METLKIVIEKKNLKELKERGLFSNDPRYLFDAFMVLEKRDYILDYKTNDLEKIEYFLVSEDIPYKRIIGTKAV